jgi:hypothetical protein
LSGCASTPPEEDPVQIKLKDLDTRLVRIERVMANQSLLEVSNQLEALRADVRAMHNDVDQLSNALESSRKQQTRRSKNFWGASRIARWLTMRNTGWAKLTM